MESIVISTALWIIIGVAVLVGITLGYTLADMMNRRDDDEY